MKRLKEPAGESHPAASFRHVSKRFGPVEAISDVSLEIARGTVHAILGENGAGKTTLTRMLAGLLRPDSGYLEVGGRRVAVDSPREARRLGIGMVHQHLALLPALTVAENLLLDDDDATAVFRPAVYGRALREHSARFGLTIEPDRLVWQMTTTERQILEICRVLIHACDVLLLDEPTAHLGPFEGDHLLQKIRQLTREANLAVVLVTHKLREIREFADVVTVLRRGRHVTTASVTALDDEGLARAMMGHAPFKQSANAARSAASGAPVVLRAEDVSLRSAGGAVVSMGISFEARRGEIVGVAGISGAGQEELAATLVGLIEPADGTLTFPQATAPVVAFVPADRIGIGAPARLSIRDNLTLRDFRVPPLAKRGVVNEAAVARMARERSERFRIQYGSLDDPTASLSGGNIQRIVLAREFGRPLDLVVAHNPTAGLDVDGTAFTREALKQAASDGAAVILISDDLDEVLELADRVIVMARGRCHHLDPDAALDRVGLGRLMTSTVTPEWISK